MAVKSKKTTTTTAKTKTLLPRKTTGKKRAMVSAITAKIAKRITGKAETPSSQEEINNRIAQTAYDISQRRGFREGFEQFDWNVAQQIVTTQYSREKLKAEKRIDSKKFNQECAKKAYELYQQHGQEGCQEVDWYVAQKLV